MSNKPVIQVASMNSVIEDLVFISHYLFKSTHIHYNKEITKVNASMNIKDKNQCINVVLFRKNSYLIPSIISFHSKSYQSFL